MRKILLLQGANMSFLGRRQPELYGTTTAAELDAMMTAHAAARDTELLIHYTHVEGEAISRLYAAVDEGVAGVLMNPAGFLYAGYALRDCLRALPIPCVEVHMTNIEARGMRSVTAEAVAGAVMGFGIDSYVAGFDALVRHLDR
ncbi:MAG: type II 3-dehydroquinate dehydratase [Betaproteobacteria bacterium]|nr:type II 3-dehydroquinate dehydratase [Betaproteobacteria bacterium]MBL8534160.1 type II 3-dehydroquinate dehydratase [Betaproteobacteria bacterium]